MTNTLRRSTSLGAFLAYSLSPAMLFADVSLTSRWDMMMNPNFKGQRAIEDCRIKQEKQTLLVRCGGAGAEMRGEVNCRDVWWRYILPDGVVVSWQGKLDKTATRIDGKWQFVLTDGSKQSGKFSATKHRN
jgi:hypothetical protein